MSLISQIERYENEDAETIASDILKDLQEIVAPRIFTAAQIASDLDEDTGFRREQMVEQNQRAFRIKAALARYMKGTE